MSQESGPKWWIRFVLVPLIGGGGAIALVIAYINSPSDSEAEGIRIGEAVYALSDKSKPCTATDKIVRICDGLTSCTITPTNALCGDPQRGTPKTLYVTFSCGKTGQPLAALPEGIASVIDCGDLN